MSSLPWQNSQWQDFLSYWEQNRLPHGLLLSGPKGLGKLHFANAISALLLCEQKRACGNCAGCHLLHAGNHPDLFLLQAEEDSRVIKIDAVRSLNTQLVQTAQQGHYKIAIIALADELNIAAGNALLKTLEEPSKNTLLILLSDAPEKLSSILRSRCQEIRFVSQPKESLEWLKEQGITTPEQWLALAEGSPLLAYDWASDENIQQQYQLLMKTLQSFYRELPVVEVASEWVQLDRDLLFYWLSQFYMDLMRLSAKMNVKHLVHQTHSNFLQTLLTQFSFTQLHSSYEKVISVQKLLHKQSNLNLQLLLESLLIDLVNIYESAKR